MQFQVDPWPRIAFYVQHGFVARLPTYGQLEQASKLNVYYGGGFTERIKYYARHPWQVLPTKAKKANLRRTRVRAASTLAAPGAAPGTTTTREGTAPGTLSRDPEPCLDRLLQATFQFSPARFIVQCYFNPSGWVVPWNAIPGTGLTIPLANLISLVLHAPHPTALWDVQIIQADEGGLDQLERELELTMTGRGFKPRIYRALTQDSSYYDYLRELVPRVRRYDYPPSPPGFNPIFENLIHFLNYALTL
jgi:hypothetical protein